MECNVYYEIFQFEVLILNFMMNDILCRDFIDGIYFPAFSETYTIALNVLRSVSFPKHKTFFMAILLVMPYDYVIDMLDMETNDFYVFIHLSHACLNLNLIFIYEKTPEI